MSYPHDDAYHGHQLAEVKTFLDERHPSAYLVFNLSGSNYDVSKLSNQVCLASNQNFFRIGA